MRPRTTTTALAAVALTALLAGCNLLPGQGGGGSGRQGTAPQGQAQPGEGTDGEAAQGGGQAPAQEAPAQPGQPIATQEVHSDGATLQVDLTGLEREGRLVTLTWNITMVEPSADEAKSWYPGTRMGVNQGFDYDVSAVSLVDPVNSKRYMVARSGGSGTAEDPGDCVCSRAGADTMVAGDASSFFASFTAPPPDVTKINVELVSLGAFNDVPIS